MPQEPLARAIGHLRRLLGGGPAEDASDGQLLESFAATRDEAAFAALMRRHGPLVLSVCRRVLTDAGDVEDAFQATFMVLVRRATSLRREGSLGSWLYGVAYRVALKARSTTARRRRREHIATVDATEDRLVSLPSTAPDVSDGRAGPHDLAARSELNDVLDAEMNQLPEKYRAPLVLCYLEGKTNEQAAEELGCPPGSMSWRLSQARDRLRLRLEGRGVALTGVALAALTEQATAAVPFALSEATLQSAVRLAAGEATGSVLSSQAALLTESTVRGLSLVRWKLAALVLFTATLAGTASTIFVQRPATAQPGTADSEAWATSVDEQVQQWQPTAEERRIDRIAWAPDIITAERLAREYNRPVFLFTHEGWIHTGRCGGSAFNLRAFSLADERVIELLNRSFVPVYACSDDVGRDGPVSKAARDERDRLYHTALANKMHAGSDCLYVLAPDGTLIDTVSIGTAKKVDQLLERLRAVVVKLGTREGPPVLKPEVQSVPPATPPGGVVLHLTARVFGRKAWCEFPAENWITLSADQVARLLPPGPAPVGSSWDIDTDVQGALFNHVYPQTENNDVSTNRFDRHSLRAVVTSVSPEVVRVRLDGSVRMKHAFYPTRPDDSFVDADVRGYFDFGVHTRRIQALRLMTPQATYGPWSFGVAVRSVP